MKPTNNVFAIHNSVMKCFDCEATGFPPISIKVTPLPVPHHVLKWAGNLIPQTLEISRIACSHSSLLTYKYQYMGKLDKEIKHILLQFTLGQTLTHRRHYSLITLARQTVGPPSFEVTHITSELKGWYCANGKFPWFLFLTYDISPLIYAISWRRICDIP